MVSTFSIDLFFYKKVLLLFNKTDNFEMSIIVTKAIFVTQKNFFFTFLLTNKYFLCNIILEDDIIILDSFMNYLRILKLSLGYGEFLCINEKTEDEEYEKNVYHIW